MIVILKESQFKNLMRNALHEAWGRKKTKSISGISMLFNNLADLNNKRDELDMNGDDSVDLDDSEWNVFQTNNDEMASMLSTADAKNSDWAVDTVTKQTRAMEQVDSFGHKKQIKIKPITRLYFGDELPEGYQTEDSDFSFNPKHKSDAQEFVRLSLDGTPLSSMPQSNHFASLFDFQGEARQQGDDGRSLKKAAQQKERRENMTDDAYNNITQGLRNFYSNYGHSLTNILEKKFGIDTSNIVQDEITATSNSADKRDMIGKVLAQVKQQYHFTPEEEAHLDKYVTLCKVIANMQFGRDVITCDGDHILVQIPQTTIVDKAKQFFYQSDGTPINVGDFMGRLNDIIERTGGSKGANYKIIDKYIYPFTRYINENLVNVLKKYGFEIPYKPSLITYQTPSDTKFVLQYDLSER